MTNQYSIAGQNNLPERRMSRTIDILKKQITDLKQKLEDVENTKGRIAEMLRDREGNMDGLVQKLRKQLHATKVELEASEKRADAVKMKSIILDALSFYANPDTYYAIGFLPDPPNGEFMNDFSDTELGHKPGKRAREALGI